jgi:hypothetical protein
VAQPPQRPFVPHRTPNKPRPAAAGASEFRLAKPFVPGADRVDARSFPDEPRAGAPAEISESLPGIDEFLAREPAASMQQTPAAVDEYLESDYDESGELPPVEHFLDPLPPVAEFSADEFSSYDGGQAAPAGQQPAQPESSSAASDWLETDWQNFDWRAAAALGETGATEASNAWSTTDWGAMPPRAKGSGKTAAHAIAKALDEIAQRIRDGELSVPGPGAMTDPATIAATLSALLGIRQ